MWQKIHTQYDTGQLRNETKPNIPEYKTESATKIRLATYQETQDTFHENVKDKQRKGKETKTKSHTRYEAVAAVGGTTVTYI